jgi:predicted ATP-binding protein involved in virulence
MSMITEIGIKKLFGYLDYHIPLNTADNITIIHGPNGCGKTWILQIINAVFSLAYSTLRSAPFDEIEFIFRDGGHFTVNRVYEERFLHYQQAFLYRHMETARFRLNFSYYSKRTKKPKEFSLGLGRQAEFYERQFPLSLVEREIPHLDRIGSKEWFDTSQQRVLSFEDVMDSYGHRLPRIRAFHQPTPNWLRSVTERVNVYFIQSQRLIRMPSDSGQREPSSRRNVTEMVELDSSELADKIKSTLASSVKIAQSKDQTFPTRLLRAERIPILSEPQLRDELQKIGAKRQQLYSTGLLDEEETVPLPSKSMSDMEKNVLSLYIQDVKDKLKGFDDLQIRISTFLDLINSKIKSQGKSLVIDRERGFLFKTTYGGERVLRPAELSSGEQQQIVLFYELIFKPQRQSLFLIDEPEISLNVGWQRRFLLDLAKALRLGKHYVLMATHSPQIIHDRWDLAVPLSGGVKEV